MLLLDLRFCSQYVRSRSFELTLTLALTLTHAHSQERSSERRSALVWLKNHSALHGTNNSSCKLARVHVTWTLLRLRLQHCTQTCVLQHASTHSRTRCMRTRAHAVHTTTAVHHNNTTYHATHTKLVTLFTSTRTHGRIVTPLALTPLFVPVLLGQRLPVWKYDVGTNTSLDQTSLWDRYCNNNNNNNTTHAQLFDIFFLVLSEHAIIQKGMKEDNLLLFASWVFVTGHQLFV